MEEFIIPKNAVDYILKVITKELNYETAEQSVAVLRNLRQHIPRPQETPTPRPIQKPKKKPDDR